VSAVRSSFSSTSAISQLNRRFADVRPREHHYRRFARAPNQHAGPHLLAHQCAQISECDQTSALRALFVLPRTKLSGTLGGRYCAPLSGKAIRREGSQWLIRKNQPPKDTCVLRMMIVARIKHITVGKQGRAVGTEGRHRLFSASCDPCKIRVSRVYAALNCTSPDGRRSNTTKIARVAQATESIDDVTELGVGK